MKLLSYRVATVAIGWLNKLVGGDSTPPKPAGKPAPGTATSRPAPRDALADSMAPAPDAMRALFAQSLGDENEPLAMPTPFDLIIAGLTLHAGVKQSPDAAALLTLLGGSPASVIRQLPAAAQASLALCDDPNITRRELAEKLAEDPALVQALLRTANSAAFGSGKTSVLAIAPALDRIGIAGVRSIIFANSIDGVLSRPGGEFNAMVSEIWNHMVRTAPIARALAPAFGADPDEAFSIALLHDVGKLVVFDRISVLRTQLRRDAQLAPAFVSAVLDELHQPVGAFAVSEWNMGEAASRAIGEHHRRSSDGRPNVLGEVVYVAEAADHAHRRGKPLDLRVVWFDGRINADLDRVVAVLRNLDIPLNLG